MTLRKKIQRKEKRRERDLFIDVYMRKRIVIKYYYPFELEGIEGMKTSEKLQ